MKKPEALEKPDFSKLQKMVQDHIDYVDSPDFHEDNDDTHYIYEEAVEAVFGKEVWKFISEKTA